MTAGINYSPQPAVFPAVKLFGAYGPLISPALRERLQFDRQRVRLFLLVSFTAVAHVGIFFLIAILLRGIQAGRSFADIALAISVVIMAASLIFRVGPVLVNHWRLELANAWKTTGTKMFQVQITPDRPPINAEFLFFLFMAPLSAESLAGDLEERYRRKLATRGRRHADVWFWWQTIRSLRSIIWWATSNVLRNLSGFTALADLIQKRHH